MKSCTEVLLHFENYGVCHCSFLTLAHVIVCLIFVGNKLLQKKKYLQTVQNMVYITLRKIVLDVVL